MINKVLLIGLDSATWRVVDPLLETGDLPNLERLIARGTSGVMHSDEYSASPVVWTSVATGKQPASHGVEDFFTPQRNLRAKRVWEILSEQDETVGVYQFLVTWPPKPLNGFVVPGWLALDETTQPPELQFIKSFKSAEKRGKNSLGDYLAYGTQALRNGLGRQTMSRAFSYLLRQRQDWTSLDRRFHGQRVDISLSTDYFCHLLNRYRPAFATAIYYQADSVGHFYWKYMEPELFPRVTAEEASRYGQVIPQIYNDLDTAVGRIIEAAGKEYTILVMSDHGMGPVTHPSGYLYRPNIASLLEDLGYATDQEHALIGIDFYLFLGDQDPRASQVDELRNFLNGIVVAETGEQLFEARLESEQYVLIRVETARPELREAMVRLPNGDSCRYADLVSTNERTSGTHEVEGIFIAAGPAIKAGHKVEGVTLTDITPTILALMGRPVARDMDGEVLVDALDERFLEAHPITYIDSYEALPDGDESVEDVDLSAEEREYLEERLRSLGYME